MTAISPKIFALATFSAMALQTVQGLPFDLPEYTLAALQDKASPQSRALAWLELHPELSSMDAKRQKQLFALGSIFFSFNGESWPQVERHHWMDYSVHECEWANSTMSMNICVDGDFFDLEFTFTEGLQGTMPKEVCFLESLQYLQLGWNDNLGKEARGSSGTDTQLEDLLPSQLGDMANLTSLSISNNRHLGGTIPSSIFYLSNLNYLSLDGNALTGSLPPQLFSLKNLTTLDIGQNQLTGTLSEDIGDVLGLQSLSLAGNSAISGPIPSQLGHLTDMYWLDISYTQISSTIPSELGLLSAPFITFRFQSTSLTGEIPSSFALLANMSGLDIGNTSLVGSLPVEMCSFGRHENYTSFLVTLECKKVTCPDECDLPEHHYSESICYCVDDAIEEDSWISSESTSSTVSLMRSFLFGLFLAISMSVSASM